MICLLTTSLNLYFLSNAVNVAEGNGVNSNYLYKFILGYEWNIEFYKLT